MRTAFPDYLKIVLGLLALVGIVLFVYAPGLKGPFVFDDFVNIVHNSAIAIGSIDFASLRDAAIAKDRALSVRPLAAVSFAINYYLTNGFDNTFWFKATNLAVHLIDTLLIFWLVRLLLRVQSPAISSPRAPDPRLLTWLPIFIAAIWALHPINLTTVLYTVQRMTSLATMFMLAGLLCFVYGREILAGEPRRGLALMGSGVIGGIGLGLLCKEIALLLPLYVLAVDYVFLRHPSRSWPLAVRRFHTITFSILGLAVAYYLLRHGSQIFSTYSLREFTLWERLLTEPRILWFYVSLLLFPVPGRFSLFHDDIEFSTGLFTPWTTLPAMAGLAGVIIFALAYRKRFPVAAFAILWFVLGHAMESSIIALELVHEHRNYLPSLGPLFAIAYGLVWITGRFSGATVSWVALVLITVTLGYSTAVLAHYWSTQASLATYMGDHHPRSARTQGLLGQVALHRGGALQAIHHYKTAADLETRETSFLLVAIHIAAVSDIRGNAVAGLPTYLIVRKDGPKTYLSMSPEIMAQVEHRLADSPVHARTTDTLKELGDCVENDPDHCGRLRDTVIRWHQIALGNHRGNDNMRRALYTELASLYVSSQRYSEALQSAQHARSYDEHAPALALMEANIRYLLGDTTRARLILQPLRSNLQLDETDREQVEKLGTMLDKVK